MSRGGVVAEARWDTGAWKSWAEPLCDNVEGDCYLSHCGSRYPCLLLHCPDHPALRNKTLNKQFTTEHVFKVFKVMNIVTLVSELHLLLGNVIHTIVVFVSSMYISFKKLLFGCIIVLTMHLTDWYPLRSRFSFEGTITVCFFTGKPETFQVKQRPRV